MRIKSAKYFVEPGQRFGMLIIINEFTIFNKWGIKQRRVNCKCDCGNEITTNLQSVFNHTKSCGCYRREYWRKRLTTHGVEYDPVFSVFRSMRSRCYYKKQPNYPGWGGRGIRICDEWLQNPASFVKWAYENGYEKGLTIERKDNDKDYSPENCIFTDRLRQANNRRTNRMIDFNDETMSLADFCRKWDLDYYRLLQRLRKDKPINIAILNCGHYKPMNKTDKAKSIYQKTERI
jgi:hypothetical protein